MKTCDGKITKECIDCMYVKTEQSGVKCGKSTAVDKEKLIHNIHAAMSGYGRKDTVPISGSLLYDMYTWITEK